MTVTTNPPEALEITPTGGALGAEIRGVDLSHPLSEETVNNVRRALLDHCVVFFRDQHISEEDQLRFTRYFGRPVAHVRAQPDRPIKEIFILSNLTKNGQPIGALSNVEISFHSDLSYMPKPGTLSILYAIEVPRQGGATQWCNCRAAYEALDQDTKRQLAGLRAVHRHYIETQNPLHQLVDHPVVRTHPESGHKSLFVSPHLTKYIVGLTAAQSKELLDRLVQHMAQSHFIWTHEWRPNDLVLWDNRPTMHRREPFPNSERRIIKRTQIFNDEIPYE
jgi:taurine dioxygenase